MDLPSIELASLIGSDDLCGIDHSGEHRTGMLFLLVSEAPRDGRKPPSVSPEGA